MSITKTLADFFFIILFILFALFSAGTIFLFFTGSLVYINSSETDFFFTMAEKFAESHTYINGSYNCQNYSKDFLFTAKNLGYEVFYYSNYEESHAYNLVAIEPQKGTLRILEQ